MAYSAASALRAEHATRLQVTDFPIPPNDQADDIMSGLLAPQKTVSPKYLYDARGSQLFDEITRLQEYYPTRTELGILQRNRQQISRHMDADSVLIEPGSGTSEKIRLLLDSDQVGNYAPIEISRECLLVAADQLTREFPRLNVHAICADFTTLTELPHSLDNFSKTLFFPGSTIGNFEPAEAARLLRNMHKMIGVGGRLLIGVDLLKPIQRLHAAYNDKQGVTAAFNLNLLSHIGRVLGTRFDAKKFSHRAVFNPQHSRIEMHLACEESHRVQAGGHEIVFTKDETIHTENSYKYTVEQFSALAASAGFERESTWLDDDALFSFHTLLAR